MIKNIQSYIDDYNEQFDILKESYGVLKIVTLVSIFVCVIIGYFTFIPFFVLIMLVSSILAISYTIYVFTYRKKRNLEIKGKFLFLLMLSIYSSVLVGSLYVILLNSRKIK